jgi:hypothetical protein
MSIKDIVGKIKPARTNVRSGGWSEVLIVACIALTVSAGFGIYKLWAFEDNRGLITIKPSTYAISPTTTTEKAFVASKTGKKYHLTTCPGAKQIAEKNKIWFSSAVEAQKLGYSPATNCPGLK